MLKRATRNISIVCYARIWHKPKYSNILLLVILSFLQKGEISKKRDFLTT